MNRSRPPSGWTAVLAAMCFISTAHAQVRFIGFDTTVQPSVGQAVTSNGAYVVGQGFASGNGPNDFEGFRWTESGGFELLGNQPSGLFPTWATDLTPDGNVVVGAGRIGGQGTPMEAYRWTPGTGMVSLGFPAGDERLQDQTVRISHDGSIIVGTSAAGTARQGFRWTQSGGMQGLGGAIAGGNSFARNVSGNGEVVVGTAEFGGAAAEAATWTEVGGWVSLGDLPGGFATGGGANAASTDGSMIVGETSSAAAPFAQAFIWTASGGMQGIPLIAGGANISTALDVSDNGLVVGVSDDPQGLLGRSAFIWDDVNGTRRLSDALADEYGLDMTGWDLTEALGISTDGTAITGFGINPEGFQVGWVAIIPSPASACLLLGGAGVLLGRRRRPN